MWRAILNAFRIKEIRNSILFTLGIIAVYRFGASLTIPGVDATVITKQVESGLLGMVDLFSGGALSKFAVFSLGIMPYITSSIIMQLLQVVIPKLEQMAKEGVGTPKEIVQIKHELAEMDSMFVNLQKEYNSNPNDERIINAMIEYYQTKLDIVNTIKTDLENVKQLKRKKHENPEI